MACGGLKFLESALPPDLKKYSPADRTVRVAMDMVAFIEDFTYKAGKRLHIKIGVHYGSCIFGVLGYHKPQFSLIGDTINTTSRHCTTADKGRIVLSDACYQEIKGLGICKTKKMKVAMKGKGDDITIHVIRKARQRKVEKSQAPNSNNPASQEMSLISGKFSERGSKRANSAYEYGEGDSFLQEEGAKNPDLEPDPVQQADKPESEQDPTLQEGIPSINGESNTPEVEGGNTQVVDQNAEENEAQPPLKTQMSSELNPPSDQKPELVNSKPTLFFQDKIFRNSESNIVYSLILTVVDMTTTEIYYWTDSQIPEKNIVFRLLHLVCILLNIILLCIRELRHHPQSFKKYLMTVILSRHILLASELIVTRFTSGHSPAHYYQLMYLSITQLYAEI